MLISLRNPHGFEEEAVILCFAFFSHSFSYLLIKVFCNVYNLFLTMVYFSNAMLSGIIICLMEAIKMFEYMHKDMAGYNSRNVEILL